MNQQNGENFSLNNDKQLKENNNSQFRGKNWFRLSKSNRVSYFTATLIFLTISVKTISPAKLALSQSVVYDSWQKQANEALILAQEDREDESSEESSEREAESSEESSEREAESSEESSEREAESSEESSFAEEIEALEEEIDEHYEEWKSRKTSVQISHSFSAITTILLTIVITLVGTGLFVIPFGRLILLILGLIAVLIQLNSNIFILEKSLAGYKILEEQGLTIKEKLEFVETEEELTELKEMFQELVLEAISLE